MIGIFDSGVGGLSAYSEVRRLLPREDIIYLADKKNAPYGTKTKEELLALTKKDIKRLLSLGAKKVLIACCTASTVYSELDEELRALSVPIIVPTARVAANRGNIIAVIATERTVLARAFSTEIHKFSESASVFEFPEQRLVSLIEKGSRDGCITDECKDIISKIGKTVVSIGADTLILGCTHFSHVEGELARLIPNVRILSPARLGARELIMSIKTNQRSPEHGRTVYTT